MSEIATQYARQEAFKRKFKNFEIKPMEFISTPNQRKLDIEKDTFVVVHKVHFANSTVFSTYQLKSTSETQNLFCPGLNIAVDSHGLHGTELEVFTPVADASTLIIHYLLISKY